MTFPQPPLGVGGGTITAQNIRINLDMITHTASDDVEILLGGVSVATIGAFSGQQWFTFSTTGNTSNTVIVRCLGSIHPTTPTLVADIYELEREVYYTQPDPTLDADTQIEAAQFGFGLELFADVVGYEVPAADTSYSVAAGNAIHEAADVFRHLLQEQLGLTTPIDETQWAVAETRLAALDAPQWLAPMMGEQFADFVGALEWQSRAQLVRCEESSGTTHRLLCAAVPSAGSYDFGSAVATVTEWADIGETTLNDEHLFTRWRVAHNPDLSEDPSSIEAYAAMIECTPDASDIPGITTGEMAAAESRYGRRDHPFALVQANDAATPSHVHDLIGYYAHEHSRALVIADIRGVPWTESYALELGDVISAEFPWWGAAKKLRLLQVARNWADRTCDLVGVEVP